MKYTNYSEIELPIAVWLASSGGYDLKFNPDIISATTLLNPPKSVVLSRKMQMESLGEESIDIADMLAAKLGTSVHESVEAAWLDHYGEAMDALGYPKKIVDGVRINPRDPDPANTNIYMELRSAKKIGNFTISGKFDFVMHGQVRDVKTTKTYNWINGSNNEKYMLQGSIYRWLNQDIITEDTMKVEYVFTDWSPIKAQADSSYPQKRVISKPLTLLTLEQTELFIKEQLDKIESMQDMDQDQMPRCTPKQLWQNPAKFAFYKNPNSTARATKLFDLASDANEAVNRNGGVGLIVERKAEPKFCSYCKARPICLQAEGYINEGLIKL